MATYVVAGAGIGATALIGNPRRISAVSVQSSSQLALKFRRRTSKTFSPIYASVSASTAPVTKPNDLVATILSKVMQSDRGVLLAKDEHKSVAEVAQELQRLCVAEPVKCPLIFGGCAPNSTMSSGIWIRIVGIPLHLWSQKVFQEIGNLCGDWVATEEETELKNHMKWARILVSNDGRNIPKEVVISRNGVKYYFPIWSGSKIRFELSREKTMPKKTTEAIQSWEEGGAQAKSRDRWRIVPACIWWTIWKERNVRCFDSIENMKIESPPLTAINNEFLAEWDVVYCSNPTSPGGGYRSAFGRLFFKTNEMVQVVEAPDVVKNRVSFSLFGFLDGEVSLKGKLNVLDEKWIQVVFEPPELKVGGLDFQYGGESEVKLEITYIDEKIRLGKGSRGSLFVFQRRKP
ncbi:putative plastid-lipid-associated protein 8, chloroplastic [Capsicum annuum]|nr:putative plastid-lipid-associated protein 8, chloroplastic [Capsicum annuum]